MGGTSSFHFADSKAALHLEKPKDRCTFAKGAIPVGGSVGQPPNRHRARTAYDTCSLSEFLWFAKMQKYTLPLTDRAAVLWYRNVFFVQAGILTFFELDPNSNCIRKPRLSTFRKGVTYPYIQNHILEPTAWSRKSFGYPSRPCNPTPNVRSVPPVGRGGGGRSQGTVPLMRGGGGDCTTQWIPYNPS